MQAHQQPQGKPAHPSIHTTWVFLPRILIVIPIVIVVVFGLIVLFGVKSVQAYESCLLIRNGEIKEEWAPGLHWRFLPMSDVVCYRTAHTTYEASPGERGGGADFNDAPVEARSKDGQRIDAVSFRIAFHVPVVMTGEDGVVIDPTNHRSIFTTVGARSEDALVSSVIAFIARPEVRAVMQLHTGEEILQGDLSLISQELTNRLRPKYAAYGVVLEEVLLSKPDFNDEFEAKLQQQQQAAIDVDIERERARQAEQQGQARINAANADATVVAIQSQAGANQTITLANAEATAVAVQIAAYGGQAGYLQAQQIEAMSNWPVQVLGDGETRPVIQVSAPGATATPSP